MASLVQINEPDSGSEHRAQNDLCDILPASWIVTTNIQEHNFEGVTSKKVELDCTLITPLGFFVLDFKNVRGEIVPLKNKPWLGISNERKNPFSQIRTQIYAIKDLIIWNKIDVHVEGLVVLTHSDIVLNWKDSDALELRGRVAFIHEVAEKVQKISQSRTQPIALSARTAQGILDALKPAVVPNNLFDHPDWSKAHHQTRSRQTATANPRHDNPPIARVASVLGKVALSASQARTKTGTVSQQVRLNASAVRTLTLPTSPNRITNQPPNDFNNEPQKGDKQERARPYTVERVTKRMSKEIIKGKQRQLIERRISPNADRSSDEDTTITPDNSISLDIRTTTFVPDEIIRTQSGSNLTRDPLKTGTVLRALTTKELIALEQLSITRALSDWKKWRGRRKLERNKISSEIKSEPYPKDD
jgi:hypothetical protein